jgi:DNA-directed RNA polymerase specialized sigma24 family protein
MNRLPVEKQRMLFAAYERGRTSGDAALGAGVSETTAQKYYRRFIAAGFERCDVRRRARRGVNSTLVYCGPVWIG